jgi:transcription elongation GreA/GreB family factor
MGATPGQVVDYKAPKRNIQVEVISVKPREA